MIRLFLLIWSLIILSCPIARAEWIVQLGSGSAYNVPTPLTVSQDHEKDIRVTARYDTKAFSTHAYYYNLRIGRWEDNHAWELDFLHHKLFLSNKPDEIQEFAISHGFNMTTINSAWRKNSLVYRVGAGFVVTHPETIVRGREYADKGGIHGYHLSGVTAQAGLEERFSFLGQAFASVELKLTTSYARIPVADGTARVTNVAIHGIAGIGYTY